MISIAVLWVVREGSGLARALNLITTIVSSASTNRTMPAISQSRKLWNQVMSSITGVADCCKPSSHGEGWPRPAQATPPAAITARPAITIAINRLNSIVLSSPSTRIPAFARPLSTAPPQALCRLGPAEHSVLPRARQLWRCGGMGGNPSLSNHNSRTTAMHLIAGLLAKIGLPPGVLERRIYATSGRLGCRHRWRLASAAVCLTGPAGHDPTGND